MGTVMLCLLCGIVGALLGMASASHDSKEEIHRLRAQLERRQDD